jgi:hypothetical protein
MYPPITPLALSYKYEGLQEPDQGVNVSIEELARSTVDAVAQRLAQRGAAAAGQVTDMAVDGIYRLITQQLQGSATGRRLLDLLQRNPADARGRTRLVEMVRDEASSDPRFADSLGRAAAQAGIFVQGAGASYQQNVDNSSGDFRGNNITGNVKYKKYHIGNIRFGTGGLAVGIVGLVAVLGGGTAAIVGVTSNSATLTSAVGRWAQPSQQPMTGWTVGPTELTISADGRFTFSMKAKMTIPGGMQPPPGTMSTDFGQFNFDCSGTVTPDGDHFTLRTTSGMCGTFQAKLAPSSNVIDVFISNGSVDGSQALTKAG